MIIDINTNKTAEKLTLSWNCKNLRILSKVFPPNLISCTIELNYHIK